MCGRHLRLSLLLSALLVVPVAMAWACTPQAHIQLDKLSYQPGATVHAAGTNFLAGEPVSFSINDGPSLVTVQASSTGYVAATFALPATARSGDAVLAQARDSRTGDVFSASAGLVVEEPAQAPAPAGAEPERGAAVPTPAGAAQPAGTTGPAGATGRRQPARAHGQATSSTASRDARAPAPAAARTTARDQALPAAALVRDPAAVALPAAAPRGAGSAGRAAAARAARPATRPSLDSVTSDLWSGLIGANRPSLATPAPAAASSGAFLGLAGTILLVLGLATVAVGIAFNNARRRAAVDDHHR